MNSKEPIITYKNKIELLEQKLSKLKTKKNRIGWLRLFIFLTTAIAVYAVIPSPLWLLCGIVFLGGGCFLFIVAKDVDLKEEIGNVERLLLINTDEVRLINGDYYSRENGLQFEPASHAYSNDLDIFGTASIYQYINRCSAEQGKILLANHLLHPLDKEQILETQQAVKELAPDIDWRQHFLSFGMRTPPTLLTEKKIIKWLNEPADFSASYWKYIVIAFTLFTLGSTMFFMAGFLGSAMFSAIILCCFIISSYFSKKIHHTYQLLTGIVSEINTVKDQLQHLEEGHFTSNKITSIKQNIESHDRQKASEAIKQLSKILNRFDARLNVFAFFFLNSFLLWDLRQLLALNKWKQTHKESVTHWFAAISQMEVLCSLASLAFNQPHWCFPEIAEDHFTLIGKDFGHPLIMPAKRIDNTFSSMGTAKVALITGSNMGGKSTFLRSIAVNAVLAMMGAPVCAASFTISPVKLMSSMRIADNLAENTSTFYAELKKLKQIIEAVDQKEKVFILLDEIFRGTNSLDRHTGSIALIKQLIRQNAVAVIATHDVELTRLKDEYTQSISNYHFNVQVDKNDELFFDFKLKSGICQSMNATILMRKIGIDME